MLTYDNKSFAKAMNNIVDYSIGFLRGAELGKQKFLDGLGKISIEAMKEYVDTSARVNPQALHHIYEWYQTGSPAARLYDLSYTVSNLGLSFKSEFRQSTSIAKGSTVPFYNKAKIMEEGIPVTITPVRAKALRFLDDNGDEIFIKGATTVKNPGGQAVQGAFERVLKEFIDVYFTQVFLQSSDIGKYLQKPTIYQKNFAAGSKLGKQKGIETGYRWIANATLVGGE